MYDGAAAARIKTLPLLSAATTTSLPLVPDSEREREREREKETEREPLATFLMLSATHVT
jgi:hypothetical protein